MSMMLRYFTALFLLANAPTIAYCANGNAILSQVFYDTPLNEDRNVSPAHNGEFIKITNIGATIADLSYFTIRATSESGWVYDIESGVRMICHRGIRSYWHIRMVIRSCCRTCSALRPTVVG